MARPRVAPKVNLPVQDVQKPGIPVIEYEGNINDPAFAELCVAELLRLIATVPSKR